MNTLQKNSFWLLASFLVFVTGCAKHLLQTSNLLQYQVIKFERKNKNSPPFLYGLIDLREDGRTYPVKIASIVADGIATYSEPTGYYSRTLPPGKHDLYIKWLGLKTVFIKNINLQQGDSTNINFHLIPDTTRYIN